MKINLGTVNILVIGCGFVFDKYMETWLRHPNLNILGISDIDKRRLDEASRYYGLKAYGTNAELLNQPADIVVNLTSIRSHFEVTKAALLAGKHVYSEKPLTDNLNDARELFEIAEQRGLRVSCAPSNALSSTSLTMWKLVNDGVIGDPKLVYAEFDTSPLYMLGGDLPPKSQFPFLTETYNVAASGAPFPWKEEFEMGCTFEHVGYHLVWMCAIFGPVKNVTGFSKSIMPEKASTSLEPSDTPDFSTGVLHFESGVVGRVTCSISGVNDTSMKVVGNRGVIYSHTYGNYEGSVYIEAFRKLAIKFRYIRGMDTNLVARFLSGVGGRRVPLIEGPGEVARKRWQKANKKLTVHAVPSWFRRRFLGQQDKCVGIEELALAISEERDHFPPHDFTLHITEITIALQNAGENGITEALQTSFDPLALPKQISECRRSYYIFSEPTAVVRWVERALSILKRH
jgi:predicted dehydrogenase